MHGSVSINELAELTSIKTDDITSTLQHLGLIKYYKVSTVELLDRFLSHLSFLC